MGWEVVKLPKGKKPVGCKWVYIVKYKANGTLKRYKARLVAKGYIQTYGVDCQETFTTVAKMNIFESYYLRLLTLVGLCSNLMLKMSSYMVICKKKSTWRLHLDLMGTFVVIICVD